MLFVALDTTSFSSARALAQSLITPATAGQLGLKLGLEFFLAHGPAGVRDLAAITPDIFLDLKLHDIPNTVLGGLRAVLPLAPRYLTLHASGGPAMLREAAALVAPLGPTRPKLLAVTVLTSLSGDDLVAVGQPPEPTQQVVRLAQLAQANGMDGIICAPTDIAAVRAAVGANFILMVPGIRPAGAASGDQKRTATPATAMAAGATHLVVGRPITTAPDPAAAAHALLAEMSATTAPHHASASSTSQENCV